MTFLLQIPTIISLPPPSPNPNNHKFSFTISRTINPSVTAIPIPKASIAKSLLTRKKGKSSCRYVNQDPDSPHYCTLIRRLR